MGGGSGPLAVGFEVIGRDQRRCRDFPAAVDLLDHSQCERALAVHDFRRAGFAANQLCQIALLLLLDVHEHFQHLDRIPLRANKSETIEWLKFTLEGVGERTHGYALEDSAF